MSEMSDAPHSLLKHLDYIFDKKAMAYGLLTLEIKFLHYGAHGAHVMFSQFSLDVQMLRFNPNLYHDRKLSNDWFYSRFKESVQDKL